MMAPGVESERSALPGGRAAVGLETPRLLVGGSGRVCVAGTILRRRASGSELEIPGEMTASYSKVHGVPPAPLAWPAGIAPTASNAAPINKKLRLPMGPVSFPVLVCSSVPLVVFLASIGGTGCASLTGSSRGQGHDDLGHRHLGQRLDAPLDLGGQRTDEWRPFAGRGSSTRTRSSSTATWPTRPASTREISAP